MPQTLGEKLRALREANGLNQFQVAEAVLGAKKRQPEVSRWEAGLIQPSLDSLVALAQLFSVSIDVMLGIASSIEAQHQASA